MEEEEAGDGGEKGERQWTFWAVIIGGSLAGMFVMHPAPIYKSVRINPF